MTERTYLDIMQRLIDHGDYREGRNGGTYSLFGEQMRFDLSKGFPLITTKRVHFKSVVVELLWMLKGVTNVKYLHDHGVTIWDEWCDNNGELGPVYGAQWRSWEGRTTRVDYDEFETDYIDQISQVIASIRSDPYSRRHIVTAWNPAEIDDMALPPCHMMFQFYVANGRLSCHLYQRSADWFLGVPFNIASYALLTHLIAREVGLEVGDFVHSFGDLHLYANHIEAAKTQLQRSIGDMPEFVINTDVSIFDIEPHHVSVDHYYPHSPIKAEVSA